MERPKILYIYDPLCGWCYGFSPVIRQLKNQYQSQLDFQVYSGGMAVGHRTAPIKQAYGYIKNALGVVEQTTGVRFGSEFRDLLEDGSYVYNSIPPCLALTVFKDLSAQNPVDFADDLQHAFFYEGKSLNDLATLQTLAERYDIAPEDFAQAYQDERYRRMMYNEFRYCQQLGVTGFPTLIFQHSDQMKVLSRGYQPYNILQAMLEQTLTANAS